MSGSEEVGELTVAKTRGAEIMFVRPKKLWSFSFMPCKGNKKMSLPSHEGRCSSDGQKGCGFF